MKISTFDPNYYPQRIVLVGAGGTGAQWARAIARMLFDMQARNQRIPEFAIVDPDVVEPHNVGRQLFSAADVGHHKAELLARRFNLALGLEITWCNELFTADRFVRQGVDTLFSGAVDNHLARRELDACGYGRQGGPRHLWIDAGNHATSGQVIIGNTTHSQDVQWKGGGEYDHLPVASLLFPQLLEPETEAPEPVPDPSCAELVAAGQQHLLVNDLMAVVAAQYTYKILHRQPISSFMTYVDLEMLTVRSIEISRDNLSAYLGEQAEPVPAGQNGHGNGPMVDWPEYPLGGEY